MIIADLLILLTQTFLGSVLGLVGGLAFLFVKPWSKLLAQYSTPFAAGVLMVVALICLLPEAVETAGENAYFIVLTSFLGAFFFEAVCFDIHHHESCDHQIRTSVPLVIIGDTIHNFIDGAAIASAFLATAGLGWITAISTFLHEVPHEIGDFGILLKAGWKNWPIIIVNVISACASLLGALLVFFFIRDLKIIGSMLAIAAGIFLYLGASDFLPRIHQESTNKIKSLFVLLLGIASMLITLNLIPHSH